MKKNLYGTLPLFILLLSGCNQVDTARGVEFFHGTFEEALQLAEDEEKLVFVDVYTSWCGPCKVMSQTVFPNQEVGEYFNSRFISFKLDAEDLSIDGPRISNTYDVSVYPTLLFLNPDGTEIGRGATGYDKEGLLGLAEDILNEQSANTVRLAILSTQYDSGDREKNFVQEYLYVASLEAAANPTMESRISFSHTMGPIFDEFIETHGDDIPTLTNEKDFQLIRHYAIRRPKSHPAVALVVENFDAFLEVVPEFALCYFVIESNFSTVIELARAGDLSYEDHIALLDSDLEQAHSMVASEDPRNAILKDQLLPRARTEYLIGTQNWETYYQETLVRMGEATDQAAKTRIMSRAAGWLMNSGIEEFEQKGNDFATLAYQIDKSEPFHVLNYGGFLIKSGELEAALEIYEEMLGTLDPSSPHYNFRDALEASIAGVKAMMDQQQETDADVNTESNTDT